MSTGHINYVEMYDREHELAQELCRLLNNAYEALIWCSGSADFADGGIAREGWLRGPKSAIDEIAIHRDKQNGQITRTQ